MRQIFLDTETTGLSADQGDRVIEVACIELDNRRFSGRRFHHYVNPGRSSHPDAVRIHGITDQFLADKPPFAAVVDELLAFVDGAEVIIHNANFDVGFLDAELARLGRPRFATHCAQVTDTLLMAREQYPGKSNSLDALCRRLEVDNSGRDLHGALIDADLLAQVYLAMTRGQDSLVIDASEAAANAAGGTQSNTTSVDLSRFALPVIEPSAEETQAHEAVLRGLDKACKGGSVWRPAEQPAEAPAAVA
jgi:DNA polymerase III subunit epsilon